MRFHRWTIGHAWIPEYGSSDNIEDIEYLMKMSPMQNIPKVENFPSVLVTTADHDDRVVPQEKFNFRKLEI